MTNQLDQLTHADLDHVTGGIGAGTNMNNYQKDYPQTGFSRGRPDNWFGNFGGLLGPSMKRPPQLPPVR